MRRPAAARLVLLLGLLAPLAPAQAQLPILRTWPDDSPQCSSTLQACVEASGIGDTVEIVTDGPIDEDVVLRRSIELAAAPGYAPVFAASRSVQWEPNPTGLDQFVAIVGLTFENGFVRVSHRQAGALQVLLADNVVRNSSEVPIGVFAGTASGLLRFEITRNTVRPGATQTTAIRASALRTAAEGSITENRIDMRPNLQATGIVGSANNATLVVDVIGNRIAGPTYENGVELVQSGGTLRARVLGNEILDAVSGGGVRVGTEPGPVELWIANNTVVGGAYGIFLDGAGTFDALIANNVLADSGVTGLRVEPIAGVVENRHNLFHGNSQDLDGAVAGEGSVFADPRFAGPDDLRPGAGSPAIDAGDDTAVPPELDVDLDGAPRVQGARVDIGAYEAPEPGTCGALAALVALAGLARRRARRGVAGVLAVAALAAGGLRPAPASAQLGIPCAPGTYGLDGFRPCTPCAPGTYTGFTGAASCQPCPAGSFASEPRATACTACGCDDQVACTVDACAATTGACSATPEPTCEPATISFAGSVTALDVDEGSAFFALGMPFVGQFTFDPLAPDAEPVRADQGVYPSAIQDLQLRVGTGVAAVEATATSGAILVSDSGFGDQFRIEIDDLEGPPLAGATRGDFTLVLASETEAPFASDAIPLALPGPDVWQAAYYALFTLDEAVAGPTGAVSGDFVTAVPEPGGPVVVVVALVLAGVRRWGAGPLSRRTAAKSRSRRAIAHRPVRRCRKPRRRRRVRSPVALSASLLVAARAGRG